MPATTISTIMMMNIGSQLLRLWLTFHQMIVNKIAQMNTTMSRQSPLYDAATSRSSRLFSVEMIRS